jgi:hypothetical protein
MEGVMVEPTAEFAQLQLSILDHTQWCYEVIRPLVLFADRTASQRAQETGTHPDAVRTLRRRFRKQGMPGLLPADVEVVHRWRASPIPEAVRQELDRLGRWVHGPVDVLLGVQADILRHTGDEQMVGAPQLGDGDGFPLQIPNGPHPLGPEHFRAADMHPAQKDDGGSDVDLHNKRRDKCHADINGTGGQLLVHAYG